MSELESMMADSSMVISLCPAGETDMKFAAELGLAIMLDKPILAVVVDGRPVPEHLRRVADEVVELAGLDSDEDTAALALSIAQFRERLGL